MDQFGIGAGIAGAARVYIQSARQTGRTLSLVESLKDGDRVIFFTVSEARRVKELCSDRGITIETITDAKLNPYWLRTHGTGQGRTVLDHAWVEQYYLTSIERAQAEIDTLERSMSGEGHAHRETRRRAREMARWRF